MSPMMKLFFLAKIALLLLALSSGGCVSSTTLATTATEIDDKDGNVLPQEYHGGALRRQPRGKDDEEDELPQDVVVVAGDEVEADFKKDETTPNPTFRPSFRPTFPTTVLPTAPTTSSPTTSCPAISPPIAPAPGSPAGAYAQSTTGCGFYRPLVGCPNVSRVTFNATATFPAADEGVAVITLPRPLNLYGDTMIANIILTSNGMIRFDNVAATGGSNPLPISTFGTGDEAIPRIAFAQEDLISLLVNTLDTGRSFIISIDAAFFFINPAAVIQVQIELFYASGDFDIRWGSINAVGDRIACGIEDQTRFALPCAIGSPNLFDPAGITIGNTAAAMPQFQCLAFTVV